MNGRITAIFQVRLTRVKKFSTGKVRHSVFSIILETIENGIKTAKPTGDGPIAAKIQFVRADFDTQLEKQLTISTMVFYIDPSAKTNLDSIKSNFKKELQKLGLYKIIIQKTEYRIR